MFILYIPLIQFVGSSIRLVERMWQCAGGVAELVFTPTAPFSPSRFIPGDVNPFCRISYYGVVAGKVCDGERGCSFQWRIESRRHFPTRLIVLSTRSGKMGKRMWSARPFTSRALRAACRCDFSSVSENSANSCEVYNCVAKSAFHNIPAVIYPNLPWHYLPDTKLCLSVFQNPFRYFSAAFRPS